MAFSLKQVERYTITDSCDDVYNLTKLELEAILSTEGGVSEAQVIFETEELGQVITTVTPHMFGSGTLWIERESAQGTQMIMVSPPDQALLYQSARELLGESWKP